MSYAIVPAHSARLQPVERPGWQGLSACTLLGAAQGAVHVEAGLAELAPGGRVGGHLHPFEESFYLLDGRLLVSVGGDAYELGPGDFGFAPVGTPHAWANPFDRPARWFRVRSPQPRPIGGNATGTYPSDLVAPPAAGRRPDEADPSCRFMGHFSDADLPPPGPLSMPGYHGHNVQNISIRMMVDGILGAQHHTLFMVQFAPGPSPRPGLTAREHFHPFEEVYYLLQGRARGWLDHEPRDVAAGDLVWASTNGSHGFVNTGDVPLRWLEVQAPAPPPANAFFFEDDWAALEGRGRA